MRSLQFSGQPRIGVEGENASLFYARHWLHGIGLETTAAGSAGTREVTLVAGDVDTTDQESTDDPDSATRIVLWDFQEGHRGSGLHACAASGVSWVIGHEHGPPQALPPDLPEKWCGLVGANLAVAALLDLSLRGEAQPRRVDVSAADVLRSFADQNAGNHLEVDHGWRRNGSVAVEHGGIYPQGFFPCRDGHVAIVGRSRKDWEAIRDVIGRPEWTNEERFDDPFALASASAEADELLRLSLAELDRDDLLERSLANGATLAPVYEAHELSPRGIAREGFFAPDGSAQLPFEIKYRQDFTPTKSGRRCPGSADNKTSNQ